MKNNTELIEFTNKTISELVYPKWELQKAYNYYNGKMDAEQFRYLEENFGIGNPTSIEFIPLVKKHIDVLIGEYLDVDIKPKITCKDSETISKITREKELKINKEVYDFLYKRLKNKLLGFIQNSEQNPLVDNAIKKEIDNLIENIDRSFVSSFEIAAQNIIQYILQSRDTDIQTKLKSLLLDLLITGYTFYRVKESVSGNNIVIEVLDPRNTFIDKNPNSPYVKDSYRSVVRKWLTKTEILNTYGKDLSKEDIDKIKDSWRDTFDSSSYYVRSLEGSNGMPATDGILAGKEVTPGYPTGPMSNYNYKLIPVYEVEWIETDSEFTMQRYSTIRIGENIYILKGKDENVTRSISNPKYCCLTVNGVYFVNRNSEPYSLILACASLQDKYNLLHFYRDNLIASSGTVGDWIDVSMIPEFLGVTLPERLEKWQAYKKAGKALVDSSQEGRLSSGQAPINTIFNGYDDTVKAQAIQAIQIAIDSVEQTVSSITGVFRERLNGIQQRDAVSNVKVGINNSFTVTKHYYQQMDLITNEILMDSLNLAKRVFKDGLTGTLILGDKYQKVFTALPQYFTLTDFDIHISTTSETLKDIEYLKQMIPEFIRSQAMDPSIIFEALTSKSLTDLKQKVFSAMRKQKEENNQLSKCTQQIEQLQEQLKQAQQALKKYETQNQELEKAKLELEQSKLQLSSQVEWFKAKTERQFKEATIEEDKKRTEVEIWQMKDGNPYNDAIKQV